MYPYYFVAIVGSGSGEDWAALAGRSDGSSRDAFQFGHLRVSPAHHPGTAVDRATQKKQRKESSDEKGRDCTRSGFGDSGLGD